MAKTILYWAGLLLGGLVLKMTLDLLVSNLIATMVAMIVVLAIHYRPEVTYHFSTSKEDING